MANPNQTWNHIKTGVISAAGVIAAIGVLWSQTVEPRVQQTADDTAARKVAECSTKFDAALRDHMETNNQQFAELKGMMQLMIDKQNEVRDRVSRIEGKLSR